MKLIFFLNLLNIILSMIPELNNQNTDISVINTYYYSCGYSFITKKKSLTNLVNFLKEKLKTDNIQSEMLSLKSAENRSKYPFVKFINNMYESNYYLKINNEFYFIATSDAQDKDYYDSYLSTATPTNQEAFFNKILNKINEIIYYN